MAINPGRPPVRTAAPASCWQFHGYWHKIVEPEANEETDHPITLFFCGVRSTLMRNSVCCSFGLRPQFGLLTCKVYGMVSFRPSSRLHSDLQLLFVEQLDFGCSWIATLKVESLGHVLSHTLGHILLSGSENGGCRNAPHLQQYFMVFAISINIYIYKNHGILKVFFPEFPYILPGRFRKLFPVKPMHQPSWPPSTRRSKRGVSRGGKIVFFISFHCPPKDGRVK